MNAPTQTRKMWLVDAIQEKVDALAVGQTITVKEIAESLRKDINAERLTLTNIDINSKLLSKYWLPSGEFERQTVTYEDVKNAFLTVISAMGNISYTLDSSNKFRIYRKDVGVVPTLTAQNLPVFTGQAGSAVAVSNPTPKLNPIKVRSLAERALDGSLTHKFTVQLNGDVLTLNKRSVFFSKVEAQLAVEDRLRDVLGLSDKDLKREIRSLVSEGVLVFDRTKV